MLSHKLWKINNIVTNNIFIFNVALETMDNEDHEQWFVKTVNIKTLDKLERHHTGGGEFFIKT